MTQGVCAGGICSVRCREGSESCRGTCRSSTKVLGGCLAAAGEVARSIYWCDPEEINETHLLWQVETRHAVERGLDPADPAVIDTFCLGVSGSMLGNYCTTGPFAAGRRTRLDTAFIYSLRFDADGRIAEQHRTPGSQSRTCRP
jgi:hypothetical protein